MSTVPLPASSAERSEQPPGMAARGPFLPVLLGLIAFLGWMILQTTQMIAQRTSLNKAHVDQTALLDQSQKIRTANDSLAGKTQSLADAGNATAQFVVAQLKQRGITINPNAATPAPSK